MSKKNYKIFNVLKAVFTWGWRDGSVFERTTSLAQDLGFILSARSVADNFLTSVPEQPKALWPLWAMDAWCPAVLAGTLTAHRK